VRVATTGSGKREKCAGKAIASADAGMAPDLRASPIVLSAEALANIVRDGTRKFRSMPKYSTLSDADLLALRHYIRQRAEHVQP
jgi:quinohemoprotein ethanol dehydrogenase